MKTYHLITATVGTFIVALAVWMGIIWGSMWLGQSAYGRGDYSAAHEYYKTAERVSPLDRWRPDFGQGTSLLAQGQIDRGILKLEEALETVPEADIFEGGVKDPNSYECLVRANLYLGYAEAGREDEATAVIETCPNPDPSAASGEEDDGEEGGDGEDGEGGEEGGEGGSGGSGGEPRDPKQEELEQRNRDAREQRQDDEEWDQRPGDPSGENW